MTEWRFVEMGHAVTGIDGSARQIGLARAHVPGAAFFHADMTARPILPPVAAFYSIIQVPAADQGRLLARVGSWLKPRGVFVGNFGTGAPDNWVEE
jgi:hypothetical protein